MIIESTEKAFLAILSEPAVNKKLGVARSTISTWKNRTESGEKISIDKMEEILIKLGATVEAEKKWNIPKKNNF